MIVLKVFLYCYMYAITFEFVEQLLRPGNKYTMLLRPCIETWPLYSDSATVTCTMSLSGLEFMEELSWLADSLEASLE